MPITSSNQPRDNYIGSNLIKDWIARLILSFFKSNDNFIPAQRCAFCRFGNRYFEKLFSITIPIPSLFSIFDYRPIML
jgi:hypothetical protein